MKKMKRLVSAFLAGMMMLAMLTACGGGTSSSDPYKFNQAIDSAATSILSENGFTEFSNSTAVNALAEKYSVEIAQSPSSYLTYTEMKKDLQSRWITDCESLITNARYTLWGIYTYTGSFSEADVVLYYKEAVESDISTLKQSVEDLNLSGDFHYCYFPVYITNPKDSSESIWAVFSVLYLVKS